MVSCPHPAHAALACWLILQDQGRVPLSQGGICPGANNPSWRQALLTPIFYFSHSQSGTRFVWLCVFDGVCVPLSMWHSEPLNSRLHPPFKISGAYHPLSDVFTQSRCTCGYCKACGDSHVALCMSHFPLTCIAFQ